jgi:hypothetical protein
MSHPININREKEKMKKLLTYAHSVKRVTIRMSKYRKKHVGITLSA